MQNPPHTILEKGYEKLASEYQRLDLPEAKVKNFGLNPGWNAVIGTYGCCGVAMSFQDNNPLYGTDQTLQDLEYLRSCVGSPLFDVASENISDSRLSRRSSPLLLSTHSPSRLSPMKCCKPRGIPQVWK